MPEPRTESQLFDYLNEAFGIGNYDAIANNETPWFKVRINEIGKLKRMLRARRVTVREMFMAAEYARALGEQVMVSGDLLKHVAPALVEWRRELAEAKARETATSVQAVIEEARAAGEIELAERLVRADRLEQQRLINAWRLGR